MAESHDKIAVQEKSEGESANGSERWNLCSWKFDKGIVVSEFLTESSLHGLKYIGQSKRHIVERAFWIVTFIVGVAAAGYLIYEVFNRYEETPVTVSFQSKEQSVDTIPFPAVTFCFNMQVEVMSYRYLPEYHFLAEFAKKQVESLNRSRDGLMEGDPEYDAISEKLKLIDDLCRSRKSFFRSNFGYFFLSSNTRNDYYYIKNQTKFQQEIIDLLIEFTPSCEEMIPFARLDGGNPFTSRNKKSEYQIFNPVITEYGKCCTFNMLPSPLMLKKPSVDNGNEGDIFSNPVLGTKSKMRWNQTDIDGWQKWSYEKGFILSPNDYKSKVAWGAKLSHPYRNQRYGYNFGLSVVVNTFEPYCDEVTFHGTSFILHNPLDTPRVSQLPSVIGSKQEVFIKIHPDITLADPDIKNLQIEKRQCLFGKEKMLKYFSPYTQENCFEDCIANLIERECGCSMFYMPRMNATVLCALHSSFSELGCIGDTLSLLSNKEICGHCLPLCEYIGYNFEMTTAKILNSYKSVVWNFITRISNEREDIFRNSSIVHIFYASPSTVPKLRKRLYGNTDLIANTGGILGLCLGFSVLSGAEVLYYVLMRTIWQMLSRRYAWFNTKGASASAAGTTETMELKNPAISNYSGSDKKSKFKRTKEFCNYCCRKKSVLFRFRCLLCILLGSVASGTLVYVLLMRNEENLKTKDTFKAPLEDNKNLKPFWAEATFCYVHQFSMEKVLELRRIAESTTDDNHRYSAKTNLSIIDAMCKYKDAIETSSSSKFPLINPDVSNYTFLMKFLDENTISCSEMLPACVYMGMEQEYCSKIIKPIYTVHGKCCRLMMTPAKPKFADPPGYNIANNIEHLNAKLNLSSTDNQNYTIENSSIISGSKFNSSYFVVRWANLSEEFSMYIQPLHFSVLSNLNQDHYQCDNSTTSTNEILFSLTSPGKFPEVQDFSSLHLANEEVVLTLFPEAESSDSPEEVMNNENSECNHYAWFYHGYGDMITSQTTKAAYFDWCSREFVSSNCKCALFGYHKYVRRSDETSTCKSGSNSTDTICLKKMYELAKKLRNICVCPDRVCKKHCSGISYSYTTTNQSMKNAAKVWASLRKFGNDTTSAIPWVSNKIGIIHFAFDTSRQTLKSTNNRYVGGFLAIIIISVVSTLICLLLIFFPHVWKRMLVKCTLCFRGVLHARQISPLNTNDQQ